MSRWEDAQFLRRESARYLGMRIQTADASTIKLLDDTLYTLKADAAPRHVTGEFSLAFPVCGICEAAGIRFESQALCKALAGCTRVIFFAATLGAQVDFRIAREERLHIARAAMMQSCGAALIEAYCDDVCKTLADKARARGLHARSRFSPGYGDLSLSVQPPLLGALQASKSIGLTLTDTLMMVPIKSVSALIGLSPAPQARQLLSGCGACTSKTCPYRIR